MKIKSAQHFRNWYKTTIQQIDDSDSYQNENFIGTYHQTENGKKVKGFFHMYHAHKPDIAAYLPSILKIAEDGQAIYEFIQNAVDCNSTHFYIFYNEKYFLAINNGAPFDDMDIHSVLNIAQTTKKNCEKIGRFGIGFKLVHRLVGKNEGADELVHQYKGPVLFSWSKPEDLEALIKKQPIVPIRHSQEYDIAPFLFKIILTNFPAGPNERVRDLDYKYRTLFPQEELNELIDFLNSSLQQHPESMGLNNLSRGSLFFLQLGEGKKEKLDRDYENLKKGVQYSMNTLKHLQKVYINNEDISKQTLELEEFEIAKTSATFARINPEYKDCNIKVSFGYYPDYKQSEKIKASPNFYKYFPMGDETNGFNFIVHCDSFSNESNRRKLQKDEINKHLLPEIAAFLIQRLDYYKKNNRNQFLRLYASLLLSDVPNKQNNDWLRPIFYDPLLYYLQTNVPTKQEGYSDKAANVKINRLKIGLSLPDMGLAGMQWFEWEFENDAAVAKEAFDNNKLDIKSWGISEIIENAMLDNINHWIAKQDVQTYDLFLLEIEKSVLSPAAKTKLCDIKLFKFSDGRFYAANDLSVVNNLVFNKKRTINVSSVLKNLGFIVSERDISVYDVAYAALSVKLPSDKKIYDAIAIKCESNQLSAKEKKSLFQNLTHKDTKFEDIADGTLKNLPLFCNNEGKTVPLCDLLDISLNTPDWLHSFKIRTEEYFTELKKFLISEKELYGKIILPFWDKIILSITNVSTFYQKVKFYYDLDEDNISFTKQRFVYVNNEQNFLTSNEVFYNAGFTKINNYQEFRDAVYRLTNTFTPDKQVLSFLHQAPFKVEHSDILNYNLDNKTGLSLEEVRTLLVFCKSNDENFFQEYTIDKKDKTYYLSDKQNTYQIWTSHKETKAFLDNIALQHMKLLPVELDEYKEENGIIRGEELYNMILDSISVDDHKTALIDIIRYEEPRRKLLLKLPNVCFILEEVYNKESFEYKVLLSACQYLQEDDYPGFREKIIIKADNRNYKLSEIPPFVDKIQMDSLSLSLARILPTTYQNSNHLSELLYVFDELELPKEKLHLIFGISNEPALEHIFSLLSQSHPLLENEQQLAFLILYNKDTSPFALETLFGNHPLTYPYYTNYYSFIYEDSILHSRYKDISTFFTLPKEVSSDFQILKAPYFGPNGFVCPYLKETLTETEKLDLLDFLFMLFQADKKDFEKEKDWKKILGFNPGYSIYPDIVAMESEQLPLYVKEWVSEDPQKTSFLSAIGVWTDNSTVVELRKYFIHQSFLHKFKIATESRFSDEKMLYNTFEWLKSKELILENEQELAVFQEIVRVINSYRDTDNALLLQHEYALERLENEVQEWDTPYYLSWKSKTDNKFSVYLFEGKLPTIYKLDKIDYIFYHSTDGDIVIYNSNNIYVNRNADIKIALGTLIAGENDFSIEHLLAFYQTKDTVQTKTDEVIELKTEVERLRQVIEDMHSVAGRDASDTTIQTDDYFTTIQEKSETYLFKLLKGSYPSAVVKWLNYDKETATFNENWQHHDFEILDNNGNVLHYIDCKGTPEQKRTFYLTIREWNFFLDCVKNGSSYQIYRIFNLDSSINYIHIDNLWDWLQAGKIVPYLKATETIKGGRVFLTLQ